MPPAIIEKPEGANRIAPGGPLRDGSPSHGQKLAQAPLEEEFRRLADRWRSETAQVSDVHEKLLHPAHLRIIGLGPAALPLIFAELEQRPSLWFWALEALTGADPVPAGTDSMKAVREAWLAYGRQKGYL